MNDKEKALLKTLAKVMALRYIAVLDGNKQPIKDYAIKYVTNALNQSETFAVTVIPSVTLPFGLGATIHDDIIKSVKELFTNVSAKIPDTFEAAWENTITQLEDITNKVLA